MSKRSRKELKNMFKTGAQPTGLDFHDFIDSIINLDDDGIEKQAEPHKPVKITSNGEQQNLLDFYDKAGAHTWRVNQYPDDSDAGIQRAGLNVESPNGDSRFFIKQDDGNIGVDNLNPKAKVHLIMEDAAGDALRVDDVGLIRGEHDPSPFVVKGDGRVGVGIEKPDTEAKLHVNGQTRVDLDSGEIFEIRKKKDGAHPEKTFSVDTHGHMVAAGNLEVKGKLTVHEEMEIKATVSGQGSAIVLGDHDNDQVTIKGKLNSGHSSGRLEVNDALHVTGNMDMGGDTDCNGTLSVSGNSDLKGNLAVAGDMSASRLSGDGANLKDLNANNMTSGVLSISRLPHDDNQSLGDKNSNVPTQKAVKSYVDLKTAEIKALIDQVKKELEKDITSLRAEIASVRNSIPTVPGPQKLKWGGVVKTAYLNVYDKPFDKVLLDNQVMVGLASVHSNGHEDRKFKIAYRELIID